MKKFFLCVFIVFISIQLHIKAEAKELYLTFDDAPGDKVTAEILDILKNNQVKGTFFIVGNRIDGREAIVKRIYNEGHGIGLHSYSHKMKYIYSSHKAFLEEMMMTSEKIYDITGLRTTAIRFPGGSKPHLTKNFLEELHSYNFKVYDWNIPVSDGLNCKISSEKIIKEGTNSRKFTSPLIILMHCSGENKNTAKALPSIIENYKALGYEFKTINNETKEYYFKPKK